MTLKIFIGYDPRDERAFRVCEASLKDRAGGPIEVVPIREWDVRRTLNYRRGYRVLGSGQMIDENDLTPFSTQFSFTRFLVPALCKFVDDLVLYMDPDMLVRADICQLIDLCRHTPGKAVYCVNHHHLPRESKKMDGVRQTTYPRKNWSSLVVWNPRRNASLTPEEVSRRPGRYLHGFHWLRDDEIGGLPEMWNWLEGWSSTKIVPKVVHFTNGTPDMPGRRNAGYAREWRRWWRIVQSDLVGSSALGANP